MSISTSPNYDIDSLASLKYLSIGLPPIRGQWHFVDPYAGSDSADGLSIPTAYASISAAYTACTDGAGDGIAVLSYVASGSTSANTTSYLTATLTWAKSGITVYGICAPIMMGARARIANKVITSSPTVATVSYTTTAATRADGGSWVTDGWVIGMTGKIASTGGTSSNNGVTFTVTNVTASVLTASAAPFTIDATPTNETAVFTSYIPALVNVTGNNNSFYNLELYHGGSQTGDVNCLTVTGSGNYFQQVHAGVAIADAAATVTYSLKLNACEQNVFKSCIFGLDTVDRGGQATYDILLSGLVTRNRFYDCETIRQSTTGTGCLAVYANTTTGGRPTLFKNCIFTIWNTIGGNTNSAYMFGSTGICDFVWFVDCTYPGFAALSNDSVAWISGEINSQAAGLMYT